MVSTEAPSPQDYRFRRGLYVMLITLGLLAAASLLYARNAHDAAEAARGRAQTLRTQITDLSADNVELKRDLALILQLQAREEQLSVQRSERAASERQDLLDQVTVLKTLILKILADSRDPGVRSAAKSELAATPRSAPQPRSTSGSTPRPTFAPKPTARPAPSPTPRPTPRPTCLIINRPPLCL